MVDPLPPSTSSVERIGTGIRSLTRWARPRVTWARRWSMCCSTCWAQRRVLDSNATTRCGRAGATCTPARTRRSTSSVTTVVRWPHGGDGVLFAGCGRCRVVLRHGCTSSWRHVPCSRGGAAGTCSCSTDRSMPLPRLGRPTRSGPGYAGVARNGGGRSTGVDSSPPRSTTPGPTSPGHAPSSPLSLSTPTWRRCLSSATMRGDRVVHHPGGRTSDHVRSRPPARVRTVVVSASVLARAGAAEDRTSLRPARRPSAPPVTARAGSRPTGRRTRRAGRPATRDPTPQGPPPPAAGGTGRHR